MKPNFTLKELIQAISEFDRYDIIALIIIATPMIVLVVLIMLDIL